MVRIKRCSGPYQHPCSVTASRPTYIPSLVVTHDPPRPRPGKVAVSAGATGGGMCGYQIGICMYRLPRSIVWQYTNNNTYYWRRRSRVDCAANAENGYIKVLTCHLMASVESYSYASYIDDLVDGEMGLVGLGDGKGLKVGPYTGALPAVLYVGNFRLHSHLQYVYSISLPYYHTAL